MFSWHNEGTKFDFKMSTLLTYQLTDEYFGDENLNGKKSLFWMASWPEKKKSDGYSFRAVIYDFH